jgi:hypothetical protein
LKHLTPNAADLAPFAANLASVTAGAATRLASSLAGAELAAALDRFYGKGKWFVFWDEDLRGKPIPGTISLAFGKNETLVIG